MMASFTAGFEQEKRKVTKLSDLQGDGLGDKVSAMGAAASASSNAGTGMSALDAMAEQDFGADTAATVAAAGGAVGGDDDDDFGSFESAAPAPTSAPAPAPALAQVPAQAPATSDDFGGFAMAAAEAPAPDAALSASDDFGGFTAAAPTPSTAQPLRLRLRRQLRHRRSQRVLLRRTAAVASSRRLCES